MSQKFCNILVTKQNLVIPDALAKAANDTGLWDA